MKVHTFFIEKDETLIKFDSRLLGPILRNQAQAWQTNYFLENSWAKPGLWVADAVAWALNKGGHYRAKIDHLIVEIELTH
jgi:hypothetical protein